MLSAAALPCSSSTSPINTLAPSAANMRASASPWPRAAPVTMTTLPSTRPIATPAPLDQRSRLGDGQSTARVERAAVELTERSAGESPLSAVEDATVDVNAEELYSRAVDRELQLADLPGCSGLRLRSRLDHPGHQLLHAQRVLPAQLLEDPRDAIAPLDDVALGVPLRIGHPARPEHLAIEVDDCCAIATRQVADRFLHR